MRIRNATSADLSAVESLLSASELPLDAEHRGSGIGRRLVEQVLERVCPDTAVVMTRRFGAAARARA